jgi:hypothetical protein
VRVYREKPFVIAWRLRRRTPQSWPSRSLLLHASYIPDIHWTSPPCCSVGISWRRRWRRSFHIARVAWSSSEPDVNTNGRTAMIRMSDSARWRRLQPSQRRGRVCVCVGVQRVRFPDVAARGAAFNTKKMCVLHAGFIAMGQRERERGACNERRAKEAAPHLLRRPHFRSTLFTGLSDTSACCWLVFMRYSVALEVMPHSATSRATGDDTSTIRIWNSGV